MVKKIFLLVVVALLCINWSNNPAENTPVCPAPWAQSNPRIVPADYGGAIISWRDFRWGNSDIYAQMIDSTGNELWPGKGVPVCIDGADQGSPQMAADGFGGAVIAWSDRSNGSDYNIYAQRIDASGSILWKTNGVTVYSASVNLEELQVVSDGSGGAIITWQDQRSGSDWDIYAQRIDASGKVQWAPGGAAICTVADDFAIYLHEYQRITPDGSGGAIITWHDGRGSDLDIYAQRIDGAGTVQWTADGLAICTADNAQMEPQIVSDGRGGAIIAWIDDRYFHAHHPYYFEEGIYAQRIDPSGTALWQEDGIEVYMEWDWRSDLRMISDGSGGAVLVWTDYWYDSMFQESGHYVCAQRINASGINQWGDCWGGTTNCALRVASYWSNQGSPSLVSDGSAGAVITWLDGRNERYCDIYGQRIDAYGTRRWANPGVAISTREGSHGNPQLVSDGAGGAIITWHKSGDLYAQNVCNSGGIGDCVFPVAVINSDRFGGIVPAEIEFDAGGSFDPDGKIKRWKWDFGDGKTASGENISHTYYQTGTYHVSLRVRDDSGRWSSDAKAMVKVFPLEGLEAKINPEPRLIKAKGCGRTRVSAACYEKTTDPDREERPIPVDLGLNLTTTAGTWQTEMSFGAGIYYRTLLSGEKGTAKVSAVLRGKVMETTTVEFTWPKPPVNLKVELEENRSLFSGEYYAYLSWAANPQEVFKAAKYRIYRSINGGSMELAAEVDAGTLTYMDQHLPLGSQYAYAVSMVDIEGDESDLCQTVGKTLDLL